MNTKAQELKKPRVDILNRMPGIRHQLVVEMEPNSDKLSLGWELKWVGSGRGATLAGLISTRLVSGNQTGKDQRNPWLLVMVLPLV